MENHTIKWHHECRVILSSLRATLFPLGLPADQVPAGTDCDLQTGGVGVVGQSQLPPSCHTNALEEAAVCADAAAAAALRG